MMPRFRNCVAKVGWSDPGPLWDGKGCDSEEDEVVALCV